LLACHSSVPSERVANHRSWPKNKQFLRLLSVQDGTVGLDNKKNPHAAGFRRVARRLFRFSINRVREGEVQAVQAYGKRSRQSNRLI